MVDALSPEGAGILAVQGRGNLKPRLRIFVGPSDLQHVGEVPKIQVTFPISANCIKSNFFSADRFKIVCALFADPEQSYGFWAPHDGLGLGKGVNVQVEISFTGLVDEWTPVFRGFSDKMEIDTHKGLVTLTGRNYMGLIMDSQLQVSDTNTPIKTMVERYAKLHGFVDAKGEPNIHWGPTKEPTGSFGTQVQGDKNNLNTANLGQELHEGDTMQRLAAFTGRMMTTDTDGALYFGVAQTDVFWQIQAPKPQFGNRPAIGMGSTTKLGPSNSTGLKFVHDFHFSTVPQIVATNYQHNDAEAKTIKVPPDDQLGASEGQQQHFVEIHGFNDADAKQFIENIHNVMAYREWGVEWKVAGPEYLKATVQQWLNVLPDSVLDSYLEGIYAITSIEYDISFERGFTQTIKGLYGRTQGPGGNAV